MPGAMVASTVDPQRPEWDNAVCPYCQQTTTWDQSRSALISDCRHVAGRTANGAVLFDPNQQERRPSPWSAG